MKKIIALIFGALFLGLCGYVFLPVISFNFLHVPLIIGTFALVLFFLLMGENIGKEEAYNHLKLAPKISLIVSTLAFLYVLVALVGSFSLFNWKTKQSELNLTEIAEFNVSVPNVDMSNLIVLDAEDALRASERLITETNPSLGSQFRIGEGTLTVVNEKPYWIFPLEYRGFFKWLSNKGEIPGYLKVSATNFNDSEFVDYTFGVCTSGFFGDDLKRLIYSQYPSLGLTDFSFEVDHEGKGMWVVTAYTHATWTSTQRAVGTIIVDPVDRSIAFYELNEQPSWVNRVYSMDLFDKQLSWYGKYINGWWNPSDRGKLKDTEGKGYVFKDNNLFFYTGLTSVGKDSATTGFVVFNPRTGEAQYNRLSGSIEQRAMGLMEELVQNAGYTAVYPYLININGEPTYFSTLKGNSGNVVGYAFASVQNYKAVAWGKSLREAQTEYSRALLREGSANALSDQEVDIEKIQGTVSRVGVLNEGYYALKLVGNPRVFLISSEQFPLVALTESGDTVNVEYLKTTETDRIDAILFVNQSIQ